MNKVLVFALSVAAIGLLFSCSSDIESAENILGKADSSSSEQGVSSGDTPPSSSSQGGSVLCDFGGGVCAEISAGLCFEHGKAVESCPVTGNSSGNTPQSSSSSLPSEPVLCVISGICTEVSGEVCALLSGTTVQSCPVSSSSGVVPSSSSAGLSSSSALPSSSGTAPSSGSVVQSSSSASPSSSGTVSSSSSAEPSSSSALPSSSGTAPSSSSYGGLCADFVEGTKRLHYGKEKEQFCDERDGKKYVYVVIDTQTWMAENLDYAVSGSKCGNSDAITAICGTYGRLYNWATAMNNSASSTANPSKVQGVCPSGWHLPSDAEWDVLVTFAGGSSGAGSMLKTSSGWNNRDGGTSGSGNNSYGFSALPGGYYGSTGSISSVGYVGYWWSATESSTSDAYYRAIYYYQSSVGRSNYVKSILLSVRCVKD